MDNTNRLHDIFRGLTRCGRNKQYIEDKDVSTFCLRAEHEGAEFYARGFASLRSRFLAALEIGQFEMDATCRFRAKRGSRLPVFMYKAFSAIFADDGTLLLDVDIDAVSCVNQLLAVFTKIEGGHTIESETRCIQRFVDNEELVSAYESRMSSQVDTQFGWTTASGKTCYFDRILDDAKALISYILHRVNPRDIQPSHGSGASACGLPVNRRYHRPRYVKSIDAVWSYSDYYYLSPTHLVDEMAGRVEGGIGEPCKHVHLDDLPEYTPCAKFLVVPKDARGPRGISCEPRETMWIQQGVMNKIVTCLEAHSLTSGLVNFTDQTVNQYAAFLGSITRDTATLDLKDASDLVSMWLIRRIFPSNWVEALEACRSSFTELPDGRVQPLAKHAPMGSATCFPVMALTLWALLTAYTSWETGISAMRILKRKPTGRRAVLVYGDDIVVSSDFAEDACRVLLAAGLMVNKEKSFVAGFFRESCGKEYYRGVDITPVRLRSLPDDDIPSRMKLIAFHNNVYMRFGIQPDWLTQLLHEWYPSVPERSTYYHKTSKGVQKHAIDVFASLWGEHDGTINTNSLSCVLNVYRADNSHLPRRKRVRFHRDEFRILAVVPKHTTYATDCWSQVLRAVVNPRAQSAFGRDALAKRVSYKYRWVPLH